MKKMMLTASLHDMLAGSVRSVAGCCNACLRAAASGLWMGRMGSLEESWALGG